MPDENPGEEEFPSVPDDNDDNDTGGGYSGFCFRYVSPIRRTRPVVLPVGLSLCAWR